MFVPRAAITYKTKDELRGMGLNEIDAYIRTLRARAKVGGYVTKKAEKELEVALKVRQSILTNTVVGDA